MLSRKEARELVAETLQKMNPLDDGYVVSDDGTIECSFGWVFFFNSAKYVRIRIISYALAGNGPVIVNKFTGAVEFCGTVTPVEELIQEYEARLTRDHDKGKLC